VRLYPPQWVAAFNEAVAGVAVAADASFRMLQLVHDSPEGALRVSLVAEDGAVRMTLDPPAEPEPQVTVSVGYEDAAALARGELDPAQLLAAGRVKVRGDLSVLVRAQAILAEAAGRLDALSERTTT
jgi:putative sterol carrier protein